MPKQMLKQYLQPLIGCTITGVAVEVREGQCWPVIMARKPADKKNKMPAQLYELAILRDPEGNGPGHIDGLPYPTLEEKGHGQSKVG